MEDLHVNTLIWGKLMSVTLTAAVHLGNDYWESLLSTKNQPQRTLMEQFSYPQQKPTYSPVQYCPWARRNRLVYECIPMSRIGSNILWKLTKICFESRISAEATAKTSLVPGKPDQKILHGLMIWKVMPRNVWNDIAGSPTKHPATVQSYNSMP